MATAAYDLLYLQASVELLDDYLLSPEIYWSLRLKPPPGSPPFPMLTLGGLYLTRVKAACRANDQSSTYQLGKLNDQIDGSRLRWRVAWQGKATQEHHSRLNLWRDFLTELIHNPENHVDRSGYEVSRRVMLQFLAQDAYGTPSSEIELLASMDKSLKEMFIPGIFIWEAELERGFSAEKFWYLWGKPGV
jgi:hypothetical protein